MSVDALGRIALFALLTALSACSEEKPAGDTERTAGVAESPARQSESHPASLPLGTGFDFYVLSLSWSPTWCGDNDRDGSSMQCAAGRNFGFIVHGLWPQNKDDYPEFCRSRSPDRVPEALGRSVFDLIPSMGLIGHQWRKHGSCSGLSQSDYFETVRAARERVRLPSALSDPRRQRVRDWDQIEKAVVAANPGMPLEGVSVACDGGALQDLRICMTKELNFTACPNVDRRACKRDGILMPAAR